MKHDKGFTLIELMIVVAIIAIIAAIAIPGLLGARRNSNYAAALQTLNSFFKASALYSYGTPTNYYWENGTVDFGTYFAHSTQKAGFIYKYFSDDTNGDGVQEASKFVYLACPASTSTGLYASYCDESHAVWATEVLTTQNIADLLAVDVTGVNFATGGLRFAVAGIVWARK
ncbi:MAG: prepilin-type N-terminal cleavage/methylation domain-containing protein [Candidatus Brocadiia bacterium]